MRDLTIAIVAFAIGVLVTGLAYDARAPRTAQPAPSAHTQVLLCAHRVAIDVMPGRECA